MEIFGIIRDVKPFVVSSDVMYELSAWGCIQFDNYAGSYIYIFDDGKYKICDINDIYLNDSHFYLNFKAIVWSNSHVEEYITI